jgi:phosphomevalonate kinase
VISVAAPGKLFVAGEYAVVEPGQPAVLVAVDRYLTVHLRESVEAGSVHSPEYGRLPLVWRREGDGVAIDVEHHPYDYVMSVITLVERLRAERGVAPRFFDLRIDSQLDDASGRKFGLGSSAAVTVATVRALDEFYVLGLTRRQAFQLALLATVRVAPTASGGDLAASTFGGWIRYSAPDRTRLRARLDDDGDLEALLADDDAWAGLSLRRLTPPSSLRLLVGWTGSPASTERLVDQVQRRHRAGAYDQDAFLAESRRCVDALTTALDAGDDEGAASALRSARGVIRRLGAATGLAIENDRLGTLADVAEAAGAAGKSSGAGGGDCGIVLAPDTADVGRIMQGWESHDIRHLAISVHADARDNDE